MVVGKIISIFDISVEVILSDSSIKIGDILKTPNHAEKRIFFLREQTVL